MEFSYTHFETRKFSYMLIKMSSIFWITWERSLWNTKCIVWVQTLNQTWISGRMLLGCNHINAMYEHVFSGIADINLENRPKICQIFCKCLSDS